MNYVRDTSIEAYRTEWREPKTRAFSIYKNPGDKSTDNPIVFSVVAEQLGLITRGELELIITQYEHPTYPGILLRYPGVDDYMAHDDHLAACVGSEEFAVRCFKAMKFNGWRTPDGNVIGRIPLFPLTVKAASGEGLSLWDKFVATGVMVANLFEKKSETSGKQLLWLSQRILRDEGEYLREVTAEWRKAMESKYPGGLRELMAVYYTDPNHPFRAAARKDFW